MENKTTSNGPQSDPSTIITEQLLVNTTKQKMNILLPIIFTFLISGGSFGFIGYYFGSQKSATVTKDLQIVTVPSPQQLSRYDEQQLEKASPKMSYKIKKEAGQVGDSNSYKYTLVSEAGKDIYSIVNGKGFIFDVSDDNKYIAIINYSESMGDETLTLLDTDGKILKEFGHLESPQTLIPFNWTDHFYWISMGIPIGDPTGVVRIDADTLKVDTYLYND